MATYSNPYVDGGFSYTDMTPAFTAWNAPSPYKIIWNTTYQNPYTNNGTPSVTILTQTSSSSCVTIPYGNAIGVDFANPTFILAAGLKIPSNYSYTKYNGAYKYKFQGSTDGSTWIDLTDTITRPDNDWHFIKFTKNINKNYKMYRLSVIQCNNGTSIVNTTDGSLYPFAIGELHFFGIIKSGNLDLVKVNQSSVPERYDGSDDRIYFTSDGRIYVTDNTGYTKLVGGATDWSEVKQLVTGDTQVVFDNLNASKNYTLYSETADGTNPGIVNISRTTGTTSGIKITYTVDAIVNTQSPAKFKLLII